MTWLAKTIHTFGSQDKTKKNVQKHWERNLKATHTHSFFQKSISLTPVSADHCCFHFWGLSGCSNGKWLKGHQRRSSPELSGRGVVFCWASVCRPRPQVFYEFKFQLIFGLNLLLPEWAEVDTVSPLLCFRSQQLSRQNCIFESETGENKHML